MRKDGTYKREEGRGVLRFERHLGHPVEVVWRAIVDPGENVHWYPARAEYDLRVGGEATFTWEPAEPGGPPELTTGTILELDPPYLLAFDEDGHVVRLELIPTGSGCTLVFTHVFEDDGRAHQHAAGWDDRLGVLEDRLDGKPAAPTANPDELMNAYREKFANPS
jgi:uncharacterized protein YndB with AHSA1/START domain